MSEVQQANMCVTPERTLKNLVGIFAILLCYAKNYDDHEARKNIEISIVRRKGGEPFTYGPDFNVTRTWPAGVYLNLNIYWGAFPKKVYMAAAKSGAKAMLWSTKSEFEGSRLSHYVFRLSEKAEDMQWIDKIEHIQNLFDDNSYDD